MLVLLEEFIAGQSDWAASIAECMTVVVMLTNHQGKSIPS